MFYNVHRLRQKTQGEKIKDTKIKDNYNADEKYYHPKQALISVTGLPITLPRMKNTANAYKII